MMTENEKKEAIKRARNEYYREWARKNPEKVKARQERYWARKAGIQVEQHPEAQEG